jgi:DNA-binding NarL/FixJ family response regulator
MSVGIMLPKIDGCAIAKLANQEFPHLKMVFLSCYKNFGYVQTALEYGVRNYILDSYYIERELVLPGMAGDIRKAKIRHHQLLRFYASGYHFLEPFYNYNVITLV